MEDLIISLPGSFITQRHMTFSEDLNRMSRGYMINKATNKKIKWDMIFCILACAILLIQILVYEYEFSAHRDHENCKYNNVNTLKGVALGVSSLGIVLRLIMHRHRRHKKDSKLLLALEISIIGLISFPFVNGGIVYSQATFITNSNGHAISRSLCYTVSEMLYLLSYSKIYFIVKYALRVFDSYRGGLIHREDFISYKKWENRSIKMVLVLGGISLLLLAEFLRVFERPFVDIADENFVSYSNSLWCILITMTTVGYGDVSPTTYVGRLICVISSSLGGLFLGISILLFSRFTTLTKQEYATMRLINEKRASGLIIIECLILNHYILKYGKFDSNSKEQKKVLLKAIENSSFKFKYKRYKNLKPHKKCLMISRRVDNKLKGFSFTVN